MFFVLSSRQYFIADYRAVLSDYRAVLSSRAVLSNLK
jgi:hypothetical protein